MGAGKSLQGSRSSRIPLSVTPSPIRSMSEPSRWPRSIGTTAAVRRMPLLDWYRRVLTTRRAEVIPRLVAAPGNTGEYESIGATGLLVSWRLGDGSRLSVIANLSDHPLTGGPRPSGRVVWSEGEIDSQQAHLKPWSVVWRISEPTALDRQRADGDRSRIPKRRGSHCPGVGPDEASAACGDQPSAPGTREAANQLADWSAQYGVGHCHPSPWSGRIACRSR